jgi:glycosyltransferase involved in cell wall biosynthesis
VPRRIVTFQFVSTPPKFGWLSDAARRLSRRLQYSTLHHLVAVSSGNRKTLERHFGVPSRRLSVIRNSVDTEIFRPVGAARTFHERWRIPPDAPIVGVAARLNHNKAQHILLQAMPTVWHTHPDTHVVLAGRGPAEPLLRAQADTLERPAQVHLVGYQSDMPTFFAQLDVCVLPSFAEGLPFAVLEAMAMSLPVVASAIDGSSEAIEHEESGLLVPPGDDVALAQALVRLLDDRELRMRLGAAARQRVMETFNQRLMLNETHTLYGHP